jgi:Ni,Fe-hydrogenase III large subunit
LIEPTVPAAQWRQNAEQLRDIGGQYLAMYAIPASDDEHEIRMLFGFAPSTRLIRCRTQSGQVPTLVDIIPAVAWDERELHDRHNITFTGHEPMRPLLSHTDDPASWTVPVHGTDPYQVAVGPIHAGIIESGHFRFHVVGEKILHLDIRLFYKHRGIETAAAGASVEDAIKYAQRACAACAVTNSVAYAHAAESALGLWPTAEIAHARTLLLELERYYNHVNDLAAICAGVGFAAGNMAFAAVKEQLHRINHRLAGHRFLFDTVSVARNDFTLSQADADHARTKISELHESVLRIWNEMLFNTSVQNRLDNVGVLTHTNASSLGAVGPTARASGIRNDARAASPRLRYLNFEPVIASRPNGDVSARTEMRRLELDQTHQLLDELLTTPIKESESIRYHNPHDTGSGIVESPRGRTVCILETTGSRVRKFHLRTGSYANWPALAVATATNLLPDFPLINKSFELCYACSDR